MSWPLDPSNGDTYVSEIGTMYQWYSDDQRWSIVGVTGTFGETGAQGLQGETGAEGAAGDQGETGLAGATGETGAQGFTGAAGTAGSAGATGLAGTWTYWVAIAGSTGTFERIADRTIGVVDASNALTLNSKLSKGTVLKWGETGGTMMAMVSAAGYTGNGFVVLNTNGDIMNAGATGLGYAMERSRTVMFSIAGAQATGTDMAGRFYAPFPEKIFGADVFVSTQPSATLTYDINKNGTTMFTTKPSLASGATGVLGVTADGKTTLSESDRVTVDIDVANSSAIDGWVVLHYAPLNNQYWT